jgi:UV excision repair protein RAD23
VSLAGSSRSLASRFVQLAQQQQQQQAAANPLADMLQGGAGGNQVQQMRQLVEQNPQLLQPLVQQLAANNPEMAAAIAQNPEMLFQLLNASMGAGGDGEGDYEEGGEALPPGAIEVELTVEERDAVERVSSWKSSS